MATVFSSCAIDVWEYAMSEEIGRRIKAAREKRHWSQAKLANAVGVHSLTVLRWEHGRSVPHYENQLELIKHLGMRLEDFQLEQEQLILSPPSQLIEAEPEQELPTSSSAVQPIEAEPEQELIPSAPRLILPAKNEFKLYRGRRIIQRAGRGVISRHPYVTVNSHPLKYFGPGKRNPEEQVVFEWGYYGTGPRVLAVAILADFFAEDYPEHGYASQKDYNALLYGSLFKEDFIGKLSRHVDDEEVDDSWEISSDQIRRWFYSLEEQGITKEALLKRIYGEEYYKMS